MAVECNMIEIYKVSEFRKYMIMSVIHILANHLVNIDASYNSFEIAFQVTKHLRS